MQRYGGRERSIAGERVSLERQAGVFTSAVTTGLQSHHE